MAALRKKVMGKYVQASGWCYVNIVVDAMHFAVGNRGRLLYCHPLLEYMCINAEFQPY